MNSYFEHIVDRPFANDVPGQLESSLTLKVHASSLTLVAHIHLALERGWLEAGVFTGKIPRDMEISHLYIHIHMQIHIIYIYTRSSPRKRVYSG